MAYEIINKAYLCRTVRSTKLYARPNDIKPTNIIIPGDITITTSSVCDNGIVKFLKISDVLTGESKEWVGLWISDDEIEKTEILQEEETPQETQFDDSVAIDEQLVIKASNILLYENEYAGTGISMDLPVGSLIISDRMININFNGTKQTRYRIKELYDPDGNDLFLADGCWVRLGSEVSLISDIEDVKIDQNYPILRYAARDRKPGTSSTTSSQSKNDKRRQQQINLANEKKFQEAKKAANSVTVANVMAASAVSGINPGASTIRKTSQSSNSVQTQNRNVTNIVNETYNVKAFNSAVEGYRTGYLSEGKSVMGTPIGRMLFVHGMPFQFTHYTDRRPGSQKQYGSASEYYDLTRTGRSINNANTADFYGRIFEKEIACNIPIMSIVPGEPQFMTMQTGRFVLPSFTGARKIGREFSALFNDLTDSETSYIIGELNADANGSNVYQYYSMSVNTDEYFKYVNTLCRMSAILMGLKDFQYNGTACTDIDWGKYNSTQSGGQDYNMFEEVVGIDGGVSFAYDPGSSVTDSIGNSLGESQFSTMLKQLSAKAREFGFMFGNMGGNVDFLSAVDDTDYDSAMSKLSSNSVLGKMFGPNSAIGRLGTFLKNAGHGMNVRFPQIWQDSSYSKSYSVEMKFVTPYATNFCKWRYVLVPFFHCFALGAPRMKNSLTNYSRPFLIRAYSKGYFNVEMGMIESLQWRRFGDGDMISDDGIPTEIDVTVDFVDMYQALGMSKIDGSIFGIFNTGLSKQIGLFFNNSGLMDLLGTLSGVNMNRMNLKERVALYWNAYYVGITNMPGNFKRSITDRLRNTYEKWIGKGM